MDNFPKPLVSVVMITYMHENFIAEAIEGVLMQDIDFDVELIIADDCSPDRTEEIVQNIINNHPNSRWIRYHRHGNNKGVMLNFIWALKQAKGKFIALCEGDDYWTDPLKLQKQVEFIENNQECNYIFTNKSTLTPNGVITNSNYNLPEIFDLHFLLNQNIMPSTQTVLFRTKSLSPLNNWDYLLKFGFNGDWILLFLINQNSKMGFLKDFTAVYREGVGIISKTNNLYKFTNGLKVNKEINKLTNYQYDYHVGVYNFHFQNITYSYLENKNTIRGLYWLIKTEIYILFTPRYCSFFTLSNWIFIKHSFKLLLGSARRNVKA